MREDQKQETEKKQKNENEYEQHKEETDDKSKRRHKDKPKYEHKKKKSNNWLFGTLGVLMVTGIVVCGIMGCLPIDGNQQVIQQPEVKKEVLYPNLIRKWNESVNKLVNINNNKDLILSDNKNKLIEKLNFITNNFNIIDSKIANLGKFIDPGKENRQINIPFMSYINYIEAMKVPYEVKFDSTMSEDIIIEELKKITQSQYIDKDMLMKIIYLSSFKIYFNDNKQKFYNKGFTRDIVSYDDYMTLWKPSDKK